MTELTAKDITPDDQHELDESLQREVNQLVYFFITILNLSSLGEG